jgi:uncharacterized OsmC-like protein
MLEYRITARRSAPARATANCKQAELALDITPAGIADAFNPAELLLTALAACMLKGIERVTPMLAFALESATVHVRGLRQDSPPRMLRIEYELVVDTAESARRLALLHDNVKKFGTIYNTVAAACELDGCIRRMHPAEKDEEIPAALVAGSDIDPLC